MLALALILPHAGCLGPSPTQPNASRSADRDNASESSASTSSPPAARTRTDSIDAVETPRKVYQIQMYRVTAPRGTLTRNENLWRAMDEEVLSLSTRDLLDKNGILAGVAPLSELDGLMDVLESPEITQSSLIGTRAVRFEIEMRRGVRQQTLMWFDQTGALRGRDYDQSTNLLAVSFRQTIRRPDHVSITLAPLVRSERRQLQIGPQGGEREIQFTQPESIYDLGASVDLPLDHFLLIAPSQQANLDSSVGRHFFTQDEPEQRLEIALLIVPTVRTKIETPVTSQVVPPP